MTRPLALRSLYDVSRGWGLASLMRCAEKIWIGLKQKSEHEARDFTPYHRDSRGVQRRKGRIL